MEEKAKQKLSKKEVINWGGGGGGGGGDISAVCGFVHVDWV